MEGERERVKEVQPSGWIELWSERVTRVGELAFFGIVKLLLLRSWFFESRDWCCEIPR